MQSLLSSTGSAAPALPIETMRPMARKKAVVKMNFLITPPLNTLCVDMIKLFKCTTCALIPEQYIHSHLLLTGALIRLRPGEYFFVDYARINQEGVLVNLSMNNRSEIEA